MSDIQSGVKSFNRPQRTLKDLSSGQEGHAYSQSSKKAASVALLTKFLSGVARRDPKFVVKIPSLSSRPQDNSQTLSSREPVATTFRTSEIEEALSYAPLPELTSLQAANSISDASSLHNSIMTTSENAGLVELSSKMIRNNITGTQNKNNEITLNKTTSSDFQMNESSSFTAPSVETESECCKSCSIQFVSCQCKDYFEDVPPPLPKQPPPPLTDSDIVSYSLFAEQYLDDDYVSTF